MSNSVRIEDANHVADVCRLGAGAWTCRYLVVGSLGVECAKNSGNLAKLIDERVAEGIFLAAGDNCEGWKP